MPKTKTEVLARGVHLQLLREGRWEYADRVRGRCAVAIVAVTEANELILTQQYRVPIRKNVIDLAAGLVGDVAGEEEEAELLAAQRELLEETGFTAENWEFVMTGPLSAGMTTELVSFYLARGATQVSQGGGDDSEAIKVHIVPLAGIGNWLKRRATSRTMIDPKVYAALGMIGLTAGK